MAELSLPTRHDPPLVLLVDDDADTLDMYGLFLNRSGFAVEAAPDSVRALSIVRSLLPDVVVTDIKLRGRDGFDLCREIKGDERTASIPVIAVTGYSTPTRVEESERAGFDAFLLKPCAPDELLAQIRRAIQVTRTLIAKSAKIQIESKRLCRETQEVVEKASNLLNRLSEDADKRRSER